MTMALKYFIVLEQRKREKIVYLLNHLSVHVSVTEAKMMMSGVRSIMISDVMVFQFGSMRNGVWQCGKDLARLFLCAQS